jgi:hypothetical protein
MQCCVRETDEVVREGARVARRTNGPQLLFTALSQLLNLDLSGQPQNHQHQPL